MLVRSPTHVRNGFFGLIMFFFFREKSRAYPRTILVLEVCLKGPKMSRCGNISLIETS